MGTHAQLTIANGAAITGNFRAPNDPSTFDTVSVKSATAWTAANLKMQFSDDGGTTWRNVTKSDGTLAKMTGIPTASGTLVFAPEDAGGVDYWAKALKSIPNGTFRLVSIDTADDTDENQGGSRSLHVILS